MTRRERELREVREVREVTVTRDEIGLVVAGLAFFALAWTPWYRADVLGRTLDYRAWDLGVTGLLPVLLSGYATLRVLWLKLHPLGPDVPLSPSAEPFAATGVALLLTTYRSLDAPGAGAARTLWLSAALAVVLLQFLCAARQARRTGLRATPPA